MGLFGSKKKVEDAINEVREALKGDDREKIESTTSALMVASQALGEKMYGGGEGQPGPGATAGAGAAAGGQADADKRGDAEDVVDAEFKEVKRDA